MKEALRVRGAGTGASTMSAMGEGKTVDEWFALLGKDKNDSIAPNEVKAYLAAAGHADVLEALGVATVEDAVAVIYESIDTNIDGNICLKDLRSGFDRLLIRGKLRLAPMQGLEPADFSKLWHEKASAHLMGTREWAFSEILAWLEDLDAPQLFWLMGGGGTGKSVLTAALLGRTIDRVVAWHFCRHDNPAQSAPASLLRSLAAMLAHRLPGYKEALEALPVPAKEVTDPKELFAALFKTPLQTVPTPEKPLLLILDALDELPKTSQKQMLDVIAGQLSQLPKWLKLFSTSREEPQIKQALSKFTPKELRADEAKNKADVEVYLRSIARQHVKGDVNLSDIEADVKRTFGIDMGGKMAKLQVHVDESREIYGTARAANQALGDFAELLAVEELRPDPAQSSDEFNTVYQQAQEAQQVLLTKIASEWEPDKSRQVGAKWKEVGPCKPGAGVEIDNPQLATRLHEKKLVKADLELTQEEIEELKVGDLPPLSFIKVGGEYMEVACVQHPVAGKAHEWIEFADSPGIKGEPRSREKMKLDYGGHANKLKDLARLTLRFSRPSQIVRALKQLKALDFTIVICKNKYAKPTPSRW